VSLVKKSTPISRSNKAIKVLRIQSRIVVGGPSLHTILLSRHLNDQQFTTKLVGGAGNPDEKSMLEDAKREGVDCVIISEMGREIHLYDDILSFWKLFRLIKKEKPAVVHTHTAKAGAIGRAAAFLAGVPYIFHTFHGHVFDSYFGRLKSNLFVFLERLLAKISTAIIVISESQKNDIVNIYRVAPVHKVKLIPLGFEWNAFLNPRPQTNVRERYQIPQEKFLIAIVGRIVPIKDHLLFIEIAQRLLILHGEQFHFMIIGDGELRKLLADEIQRRNIAGHFTFTGWLELNCEVYRSFDLLLLTSKNEGTPVAIIEALAAGTPVAAAAVGGVPDIFKMYDPQFLVHDRSPESFVEAILRLRESGGRVSPEVSRRILEYFSVYRLVEDVRKLYLHFAKG